MLNRSIIAILASAACVAAAAGQSVTLSLTSPQNSQTVAPGATINWTIAFTVSTGNNQGLALLCTDLTQDVANPATLDIPQAASVPGAMTNFARPAGVSNPSNGYQGTQIGTVGAKNLVQIGGAQNTFGVVGPSGIAQSTSVASGVGQSGSVTLASGSFSAPSTAGVYTFRLANAFANTIVQLNSAPTPSTVSAATTVTTGANFSFTVSAAPGCLRGDANCDNLVNNFDIDFFVNGLLNLNGAYLASGGTQGCYDIRNCWGDINQVDGFNNFDIDPFVACILSPPGEGFPCP